MKAHDRSPIATPLLIGLSLLLIGAAYITALWALTRVVLPTLSKSPVVEEVLPAKFSPQLYQLEIVDSQIKLAPKTIDTAATSAKLALAEALKKLLVQSSAINPTSAIPSETRLLDLDISENGVYVDLSQEFTYGGGSSSMIYRVAQILYTASSINPQTLVFLSIEGRPLNNDYPLGGEGLTLEYPMTRQQFKREFLGDY